MLIRVLWRKRGCDGYSVMVHSTSGNPFVGNSPEASTNIVTIALWHVSGTFGCWLESWRRMKYLRRVLLRYASSFILKNVCVCNMFCAMLYSALCH